MTVLTESSMWDARCTAQPEGHFVPAAALHKSRPITQFFLILLFFFLSIYHSKSSSDFAIWYLFITRVSHSTIDRDHVKSERVCQDDYRERIGENVGEAVGSSIQNLSEGTEVNHGKPVVYFL
jgi:hypothetical protein